MSGPPTPLPFVFIVGCERSGTTWVRSLFEAHPEALAPPHESHVWLAVDEGAQAVAAGRTWDVVLDRFDAGAGGPAGLHHWIERPTLARLVAEAGTRGRPSDAGDWLASRILAQWAEDHRCDGARLVVEKTPSHVFFADRIARAVPGARFVEVRRDGRDVCVSMEHRARTKAWVPRTRQAQIERWVQAIEAGLEAAARPTLRDQWHVVAFERLKADPVAEITAILTFVGLDASPGLVAAIADATRFDRHERTGPDEHRRRGEVGDWQAHFDAGDRRLFVELAGPTATAAGYPPDPGFRPGPDS